MDKYKILKDLVDNPHRLGFLVGKTKLTKIHSEFIKYIWYPKEYYYENDNTQKTVDYFNSLGKTFEILNENNQIERVYLTKERFLKLIEDPKRSLQAHRGSYKTSAIASVGIILRLLLEPDIRICIVRKDYKKACEVVQTVSKGLLIPEIKELFNIIHGFYPKALTNREDMLAYNFKKTITPEGNVNAYGVHQDMTGKHFDFILADDFVTLDDKISKAERDKTKTRLEDIKENILDPGRQMGLCGTPWHKDDAWIICPHTLKFDIYTLDILTEEQKAEKRKSLTPVSYAANHELRHVASDSTMFKNPQFERWLFYINTGIGALDKAYTGKDTNALAFGALKSNGRYQVLGKLWNDNIKNHYEDIYILWKKYKIGRIYTENNDDKSESTKDRLQELGIRDVEMFHESLNKHVKIQDYLYENGFWDLIDFDPDTDPEFINQVLDYTGNDSEFDDCCDVLADLGRELIGNKNETKYTDMYTIMMQNDD